MFNFVVVDSILIRLFFFTLQLFSLKDTLAMNISAGNVIQRIGACTKLCGRMCFLWDCFSWKNMTPPRATTPSPV